MAVCLVLKRAEPIDAGAMDGLIVWEDHVKRVDIRFVCVRLLSAGAMSGVYLGCDGPF